MIEPDTFQSLGDAANAALRRINRRRTRKMKAEQVTIELEATENAEGPATKKGPRRQVAKAPAPSPAPAPAPALAQSETSAFLAMIERAARDPDVSIEKMERLYDLSERARASRAREEFADAFARLLAKLPSVDQTGRIVVYSKADREKNGGPKATDAPQQNTPYATLDGILEAIFPALSEEGFSVRFEHETVPISDSYRIATTAILTHKGGHSEKATTPPLLQDSTGSKNAVQAVGSALKYGRRYALLAVLPIASHAPQDKDDDGNSAVTSAPPTIEPAQVAEIQKLLQERDASKEGLLKFCGVESILEIPAVKFAEIVSLLKQKPLRKAANNGDLL